VDGLGRHLDSPPPSSFPPLSPYLHDICPYFLMLIVPLDAALLFDVNAAILGWLLLAVQPQKQHPRHNNISSR
jgi:hypothetical protein